MGPLPFLEESIAQILTNRKIDSVMPRTYNASHEPRGGYRMKHIPFEKLSKKKQRELNAARRSTWGSLNPATRKPENSKAYKRCKTQRFEEA